VILADQVPPCLVGFDIVAELAYLQSLLLE
jgi:hypothetical protein